MTLVYFTLVLAVSFLKDVFAVIMVVFVNVTILNAVSTRLKRVFRSKAVSDVIVLSGFFLLLVLVLATLVPAVVREFGGFYSSMIDAFEKKSWENYIQNPQVRGMVTNLMDYLQPRLEEFVNFSLTLLTTYVPSILMFAFFAILGTIYTLLNTQYMQDLPKILYPRDVRHVAEPFLKELFQNLGRFVLAIFVTATLTGVLFFMVFEIFNLKYSVTIGVWAFMTNFIPIVGVLFEYVPVFLFSLSLGMKGVLLMAVITLMIHTVAFVTFLHMMKGHTKINPVEMLLFIMILGRVYGLLGIFAAVPVAVFVNIFWKHFLRPHLEGSEL